MRSSIGTPMIRPAAVARRRTRPASDARNRRTSSGAIVMRRGARTVVVRVVRIARPYPLGARANRLTERTPHASAEHVWAQPDRARNAA